ncbi:hypothetical protein D3C78_1179420 [compost metagenome]
MRLQIGVDLQLIGQFVQVGALGLLLIVHQHHAGQIHFRSHARVLGGLRDVGGIQRTLHFLIEPFLQLGVTGMPGDFRVDHLFLVFVDAPVGLGRGDQRAEDRIAVILDFRSRELIDGAQCLGLSRRGSLALLPALVGLEGHHAERSQRRVVHAAATTLAAHATTAATEHAAEDASQAAAHSSSTAHAAGGTAATAAEHASQQVA